MTEEIKGEVMSINHSLPDSANFPYVVHLRAYKTINGKLAYRETTVSVEILEDSPIGRHLVEMFDAKFREMETEDVQ